MRVYIELIEKHKTRDGRLSRSEAHVYAKTALVDPPMSHLERLHTVEREINELTTLRCHLAVNPDIPDDEGDDEPGITTQRHGDVPDDEAGALRTLKQLYDDYVNSSLGKHVPGTGETERSIALRALLSGVAIATGQAEP